MVNKNRIVPITKTDLLTIYATMIGILALGGTETVLKPNDTDGDFNIDETFENLAICNQPVESLNFSSVALGGSVGTIFFVAAYNFKGISIDGLEPQYKPGSLTNADIIKDSATLYSVAQDMAYGPNSIFIKAITPTED